MGNTRSEFGKYLSIFYRNFQVYINRELAEYNVTSSEYAHLLNLDINQEVNQSYFSNALSIDRALTTRVLKGLEKKEFIVRRQDPDDKRNTLISLSPKGEVIKPILIEAINRWELEIYSALSKEDFSILEEGMKTVALKALQLNTVKEKKKK